MNKRTWPAFCAVLLLPVLITACASAQTPSGGVSAAASTNACSEAVTGAPAAQAVQPDPESVKKKEKELRAAGKAAKEAMENAAGAADQAAQTGRTGTNVKTESKEKEKAETELSPAPDCEEREEDAQEQAQEPEDSSDGSGGESDESADPQEHRDDPAQEESRGSHRHNWVEEKKTVHHEETGHYEEVQTGTRTVVDEEAWDEPVYETKSICSKCGYEADSTAEINDHLDTHYDPELGYIDASYSVQEVVVDTIHHPEVTHEEAVFEEKWIVDSEAWDEEVVTGYRCSICGELR